MHYCSASFEAVPAWNSTNCTTVLPLSGLFLPIFDRLQYCFASFRAISTWNSPNCFTVQLLSGLFLPGIRLLTLLFSLCQGCSCLEFVCIYCCSASVRAVPAWNSFACTPVQPVSGLFLPGNRLLALLFSMASKIPSLLPS